MTWPASLPDYRWPAPLLSPRSAPRRWALAALFHVCHAIGRFIALVLPNPSAILLIRTDGMGDALLAEPMMASLVRRFPDHAFVLWAPAATCELMQKCPYVARRFEIPRGFKPGNLALFQSPRWRAVMGYRLGRWNFAIAAYLADSPEPLGNWLLASVAAESRWYNPGDTQNQFPDQQAAAVARVDKIFSPRPDGGHELLRNAHLARQWADTIDPVIPAVHYDSTDGARAEIIRRLWHNAADRAGASQIVGLVPSSAASLKEYPHEHWAAVAKELWQKRKILCALLGGPHDFTGLDRLAVFIAPMPCLRLPAPLPLPTLAALIGRLNGLLSVDTGMAHIALAHDLPSVILSAGGHPGRFLPWPIDRQAIILNHRMPCEGCLNHCILATPECITRITPQQIVDTWIALQSRQRTVAA